MNFDHLHHTIKGKSASKFMELKMQRFKQEDPINLSVKVVLMKMEILSLGLAKSAHGR